MKPESTNELPPPSEPEVIPCFVSTEDMDSVWRSFVESQRPLTEEELVALNEFTYEELNLW